MAEAVRPQKKRRKARDKKVADETPSAHPSAKLYVESIPDESTLKKEELKNEVTSEKIVHLPQEGTGSPKDESKSHVKGSDDIGSIPTNEESRNPPKMENSKGKDAQDTRFSLSKENIETDSSNKDIVSETREAAIDKNAKEMFNEVEEENKEIIDKDNLQISDENKDDCPSQLAELDRTNVSSSVVDACNEAGDMSAPSQKLIEDVLSPEIASNHRTGSLINNTKILQPKVDDVYVTESEIENAVIHADVPASLEESLTPVSIERREVLSPFTEEQLKSIYQNQELDQVPVFIDQFLQSINLDSHEFYELVDSYHRGRIALVKAISKIKGTQNEASACRVWAVEIVPYTLQGKCNDKNMVESEIKYNKAKYNGGEAGTLKRLLRDMRELVHEEFQLQSYNSQLAKIRIENYIHEVIEMSSLLKSITTDSPLSAKLPRDLHRDAVTGLRALQDAITILFSFKRLGSLEAEFSKDLDNWLSMLVSILQRAGALPDHFFILNHVLRCPPGCIEQLANHVQFPDFKAISCERIWDSPLVHHFIVMLATIALPIKEREKCLMRYKEKSIPTKERAMSWTLVDENREEDEDPAESWHLLLENDLVALFDQFPFEGLLQYLLLMENVSGEVKYSVTLSTSDDILHLLAFSSCLVHLLGRIFDTYNWLRYRQFLKRISRTIRYVVQIVSDHWCAYRSWRIEVCGDSHNDIPKFFTVANQFSLERLQLEFDQFFTKAAKLIQNSQSVAALQFLASMPFDAISTDAAWTVLGSLLQTPEDSSGNHKQSSRLKCINGDVTSPEEMIYLITALSNMAISRSSDDRQFITYVAACLLEISHYNLDEFSCQRDCRDLLSAISVTHPFIISTLIRKIGKIDENYLENCVYLLKALPLDIWNPEVEDLELLRSWLLNFALVSKQHQLARTALSKMNFDMKQETGSLFLPKKLHFSIAVMLVEVYGSCFPDSPGGLQNLEYENTGIINQVGKFAFESIHKFLTSQSQEEFLSWCWDVMLSLKLHVNDGSRNDKSNLEDNVLVSLEESQAQENGSWFGTVLATFETFSPDKTELEHCPVLLNVKRALHSKGSLSSYVALTMTRLGHSPEMFLKQGVTLLSTIQDSGRPNAVLKVISVLMPLFVKRLELIVSSPGFLRIMDTLVHLDASKAGYTEKILQYPEPGINSRMLASLIITNVTKTASVSSEHGKTMISCWFRILAQKSTWHRDYCVQYLLDELSKVTYLVEGDLEILVELLLEQYQILMKQKLSSGLLSTVFSWVSTAPPISLLEIKKQPDYSYFSYAVLLMEKKYEESLGVWERMTSKLAFKPKMPIDAAYKKAISKKKALYIPNLQYLSIYRWVDLGLSTGIGHPLLPLIWQQFFILYLQKQNTAEGLPSRVGVGYRFLDTDTQFGLPKKIRNHLNSAANHHREKSLRTEGENGGEARSSADVKAHIHDETMHSILADLYQAMALWIEESRLQDSSLFVGALPDIYKPAEVTKIFQGDQKPWLQYVDKDCMKREVESLESFWTVAFSRSAKSKYLSREESQQLKRTASQRLIKRLNRESMPRRSAPFEMVTSPIPEVSLQLLLTRPRLIQELNSDLERILLFAKKSSVNANEHAALDEEYIELLSDLYTSIAKHVVQNIKCDRGNSHCSGAARLSFEYEESEIKDRSLRRLTENRDTCGKDVIAKMQPLPHNLCVGAVYVETVISKLMESLQYANAAQRSELESAGIHLFYLLANLINSDVKDNSPAIQFFSSNTEVLGKELIVKNEVEQSRLVKTILAEDATVSFLAPHFNPSPHFRTFLHLYSTTIGLFSDSRLTALFVIFSKFDVRAWLALSPSMSECTFMLREIVSAMENFGKEPCENVDMLFGLFRSHLELMLCHNFPQQFGEELKLLFESCHKGKLPPVCLGDFLSTIGCTSDEKCPSPGTARCQLTVTETYQAVPWLCEFFFEVHKSFYYSNSKLYAAWKPYIPHIVRLLPFLFSKQFELLTNVSSDADFNRDRYVSKLWNDIFSAYRPWLVPHQADSSWPTLYVEDSLRFIQSFTETVRSLCSLSAFSDSFSRGLNMIWVFYCAEIAVGLRQDNALEIYHGSFLTLPWSSFFPSFQDLDRMLQLYATNPPAFHFLGAILCTLKWPLIMSLKHRHGDRASLKDYLTSLLRIFVMLSTNKPFMEKTISKFSLLVHTALEFHWCLLDDQNVEVICEWYSQNCDPASVFEDESFEKISILLLKTVCCMVRRNSENSETESFNASEGGVYQKQTAYVRMLVTIITRAASKDQATPQRLEAVVSQLLVDIEREASASSTMQFTHLCSSVLLLLNSVADGPVLRSIESRIHVFLSETNSELTILCVLSAACRVLAGLDQLVTLSESAIECFFNRLSDVDYKDSWAKILAALLVPDLNQDQFVRKALSKNCLLTLYAYNLHRFALCSDAAEEMNVLKETFHWCLQIMPSPACCEKYLLVWWQIFCSVKRQVLASTHDSQYDQMSQYLSKFVNYLQQVSEDKKYSGILGAIGLGKKSTFPMQFRFVARSLYTFLLAKMPLTGVAAKSDSASKEAKNALQSLSQLSRNKHYVSMKDDIAWVSEFISNSQKCMSDAPELLEFLCKQHYFKVGYVAGTIQL